MSFLKNLTTALFDQVGLGENANHALADIRLGDFSSLGKFADKIDRNAHRQYLEDGIVRNLRPRNVEVLMQQPDITVVIKKRIFSSLSNNFQPQLMDEDEKLFLKATKKLFENKCRAIAAYERLSKFEQIATNTGLISDSAIPLMFNVVDSLDALPTGQNLIPDSTRRVLEAIRQVKAFSDPNLFTTWIADKSLPYSSQLGEGTGTFELTLVTNFSSKTSVETGQGSAHLSLEDPYKLTFISSDDIEQAIGDVTNSFSQNSFFKVGELQLQTSINDLKEKLNMVRALRGATSIIFKTIEEDVLFKKVRAFIDEEGREIVFNFNSGILGANLFTPATKDSAFDIEPNAFEGQNGLKEDNNELGIFKQIIKNIYILIGQRNTLRGHALQYNTVTDNLRRKMWLHYRNKAIIQPMDIVNIFVSSKPKLDAKVAQGLDLSFKGSGFNNALGKVEDALQSIKSVFDTGGSENTSYSETEKNLIAGPEFPMWLWIMMRNDFTRQTAGTCVFAGPVTKASRSYNANSGSYTLSVDCEDNIGFFKKSEINVNPSPEVFNGPLYDPLTPFKNDFDDITGFQKDEIPNLLDANIELLNTKSVRAKNGRFRGQNVDLDRYFNSNEKELIFSGGRSGKLQLAKDYRNLLFEPDGFVYRWKEGIGSLTMVGDPSIIQVGSFKNQTSVDITTDPFAGQDIINVLSLLVTGEPYNFNNFIKAAFATAKLNKDDFKNQNISTSFFRSLLRDIKQKNSIWGNFIPFKKMVINETGTEFLMRGEFELTTKNATLSDKIRQRAELIDQLSGLVPNFADHVQSFYKSGLGGAIEATGLETNSIAFNTINSQLIKLNQEIDELTDDFNKNPDINLRSSTDGTLEIAGNDISFDPTIVNESETSESKKRYQRNEFRRKLNSLLLRRLWKVKGNSDINYFVVDDSYDKNYDLRTFEKSFAKSFSSVFNSGYSTIFEKLNVAGQVIGLELFADSQGHIQARPPQYNRVPSSVFAKMLQDKISKRIRIFPKYLERLFFNNVKGFSEQLGVVENEIRLRAAALGRITDGDISRDFGIDLVTSESGQLGSSDVRTLFLQDSPDLVEQQSLGALKALQTPLKASLNSNVVFSIAKREELITSQKTVKLMFNDAAEKRFETIRKVLLFKSNDSTIPESIGQMISLSSGGVVSQLDIVKLTDEIAGLVSERQRIIKFLSNSLKNLTDGLNLEKDQSGAARELLYPNLRSKDTIPDIIEHMVEDESIDDLGIGSGNRYVIREDQILSINVSENQPAYNMVEVNGRLDEGNVPIDGALQITNSGGNLLNTAWAVDYDLWQMYGLQTPHSVTIPFFENANSQCAPFAVFLLNLARKNIIKGSTTIAGNEYIQAGEVYYIEDLDLLFYATDVEHSFTYNQSFTTSMQLAYGHNPGEYIPTHLDIIGKAIYSNRHVINDRRHVRHDRADDSQHIATLIRDTTVGLSDDSLVGNLITGKFGDRNKGALGNILLTLNGFLTPNDDRKMKIEVRVYSNSHPDVDMEASSVLKTVAKNVSTWLVNPTFESVDGKEIPYKGGNLISTDSVKVIEVDLSPEKEESNSPSQEAWHLVREVVGSGINLNNDVNTGEQLSTSFVKNINNIADTVSPSVPDNSAKIGNLNTKLTNALINCVIDIWVKFESVDKVVAQTDKTKVGDSQANQLNLSKVTQAIKNNTN